MIHNLRRRAFKSVTQGRFSYNLKSSFCLGILVLFFLGVLTGLGSCTGDDDDNNDSVDNHPPVFQQVGQERVLNTLLYVEEGSTIEFALSADDPDGDVVIWGRSYTLASGEKIRGDLLVYGGNVTIETNSEVKGDVTVFGGNLSLAGEVDG